MPVITALEFDDLVPLGVTAGQSNRAHRRLGAGASHANQVDSRHQRRYRFGKLDFERGRCAETETLARRIGDRGNYFRMRVPANHRPPGGDVIDVSIAVDIEQVRAFGAIDKRRRATHRGEGAHRRINTAGNDFACAGE